MSEQHNSSCALDIKTFFRDVLAPFKRIRHERLISPSCLADTAGSASNASVEPKKHKPHI